MLVLSLSIVGLSSCKTTKDGSSLYTSGVIQSNPNCDMCVVKLEGNINEMKGVRTVRVNLNSGAINIKYAPDKVSLDEIRKKVTSLGYDADTFKADPEVYKLLPDCCKK